MSSTTATDDGEELVDVTTLFDRAASSLTNTDPLLCNQHSFSLQDSMAALEVMDPIMDCCELPSVRRQPSSSGEVGGSPPGQRRKTVPPRDPPRGLNDPRMSLPWDGLTLRDARTIALEAASRLESTLSGSGAAESTYTFLYAHNSVLSDMASDLGSSNPRASSSSAPPPAEAAAKRAVYASALLLVKMSETARSIAQHADIYEEEDSSINAHGFDFSPGVDAEDLAKVVDGAVRALEEVAAKGEDATTAEERDNAEVLCLVLGFQLDLFNASVSLSKLTATTVRSVAEQTKAVVASGVGKLNKLQKLLSVSEYKSGGVDAAKKDASAKKILDHSFDSYINRRLLGNTPVRKVKFQKPENALATLVTILSELDWAVCDLLLSGSTLARIKRMLAHVSISSVNILSRSLIVLNLYFDDLLLGQYDLGQLVAQNMQQVGGVPKALTDSENGQTFLTRLGKPFYDTLKVLALNRNRQPAYMDALMLREWSALQREATAVDYMFRQENGLDNRTTPFVTNYVLSVTIWLMEHYICLAVELGLFRGHHDLAVAYWYWDFLLSTQLNVMIVMRKAKVERKVMEAQILREEEEKKAALELQSQNRSERGKKKGKKAKSSSSTVSSVLAETKEDLEDNIDYMVLGLRRTLCRGIVRFIAALDQAELLSVPTYEFTSHQKRFEKRFQCFAEILQPPPLTYDDFRKGYSYADVKQLELLASSSECFKASKAVVDNLLGQIGAVEEIYLPMRREEVMKLAKVCVGNSLFLHKLKQQVKDGGKAEGFVSFDFQSHCTFCSIKIT